MMKVCRTLLAFMAAFFPNLAFAQSPSLEGFLMEMDLTEVTFQGYIKYNSSSLNDVDFTYYNTDGEPFAVTIDAGRKTRERIEQECENSSFMTSLKDFCTISGNGTVEIRGSRVQLSIDNVVDLGKP